MAEERPWSLAIGVGADDIKDKDVKVAVLMDGHRVLMGASAARHFASQLCAWADQVDKANEEDKEKGNAQER